MEVIQCFKFSEPCLFSLSPSWISFNKVLESTFLSQLLGSFLVMTDDALSFFGRLKTVGHQHPGEGGTPYACSWQRVEKSICDWILDPGLW